MRDVLSISVDDLLKYTEVRTLFGVTLQTPNLDRLTNAGVSFDNNVVTTALCEPSRTAILTGQSPFTTNVHHNTDTWDTRIDPTTTLPAVFMAAGYDTLGFGKVFASLSRKTTSLVFDSHVDHFGEAGTSETDDARTADRLNIVDAIAAMQAHDGTNPLAMFFGLHDPHGPQTSPQEYRDLYPLSDIQVHNFTEYNTPEFMQAYLNEHPNATEAQVKAMVQAYFANISEMDARLGELLDAVEADPDYNPIIALWSDHGYSLGDHDHHGKFTLWDQTGRAPLIIVDPEQQENGGSVYTGVNSSLDIAPTLLDLANIDIPAYMQGRSLADQIADPGTNVYAQALTTMFGSVSLRTPVHRFTRYEDGSFELFNVVRDPENVVNLYGDPTYADVVVRMQSRLTAKLAEVGVVVDEARDLLTVDAAGTQDSTYFVTYTSDLAGFDDGGGHDLIYSALANFTLPDWAEDLSVTSTKEDYSIGVSITGNTLDNLISGSPGNDTIRGLGGSDTIYAERGDDVVHGSSQATYVDGGLGNDILNGRAGRDTLIGNHGDDSLAGSGGNDLLNGVKGNDLLRTGPGQDTLVGGSGDDTFMFRLSPGGHATVKDYTLAHGDTLVLLGVEWNNATFETIGQDTVVTLDNQTIVVERDPGLTIADFTIEP